MGIFEMGWEKPSPIQVSWNLKSLNGSPYKWWTLHTYIRLLASPLIRVNHQWSGCLFCFWVLVTFLSHKEALIVMTWAQKNWVIIKNPALTVWMPNWKVLAKQQPSYCSFVWKEADLDRLIKTSEFFVLAGGEHSYRLVWKRHSGSCKEWNRQEWSLSHPNVGEDRLEKGPHTGWGTSCMKDYVM